ncbi:MAG: zinc-binding dehydrogenase [Myxococcales bacterium]|nr:zinc-binding dehydrogenase [Myxococcales bacterium]
MAKQVSGDALQLRSMIKQDGTLELSLAAMPIPQPKDDEVLVRVEASPINPSDLGLLFGAADPTTMRSSGSADRPVVTASVPDKLMRAMTARVDKSLPVGNEGAGIVVAAGAGESAQALVGKTVGIIGGAMYSQYRCVPANQALPLADGTTPAQGASWFVNPLTSLGMVETMRLEDHKALVHTAAASNLGQMLHKVCLADDVPLVNIVRKGEQVELLRGMGASHVCNSSEPTFMKDLTDALITTGATLAFDAIGGGTLAGQILTCMEAAASATGAQYSPYGTTTHKQVYIYGGLDRSPIVLARSFGMAWGVGGWLLFAFLQKIGPQAARKLQERVAAEIKTTFASSYTREVSLAEALTLEAISVYGKQATGEKYLINPNKGLA